MIQLLKSVFVNRRHEIRSGWKLGILMVSYLIIGGAWQYLFPNVFSSLLATYTVDFLILVSITFATLKWIDRKRFRDIGFSDIRQHWKELSFGLVLGAVSITVIFIGLALTGQIAVQGGNLNRSILNSLSEGLVLFVLVAIKEELFSRGYCLLIFFQMRKLWLAVLLSSAIFAALHGSNPNASGIGIINIFLVGILFSFMAIKTGNLWMPIGYHITWNYFQGNVFGFPVSGKDLNGLYHTQILHNNFISGGLFGPEGGILTTGAIIMGFVVVWLFTIGREIPERFVSSNITTEEIPI